MIVHSMLINLHIALKPLPLDTVMSSSRPPVKDLSPIGSKHDLLMGLSHATHLESTKYTKTHG